MFFCLHFKTKKKIQRIKKKKSRIFKNLIFFTKLKTFKTHLFIIHKPDPQVDNRQDQMDKQIDRQIDNQTDRQKDRQIARQIIRQIDRKIEIYTYRQIQFFILLNFSLQRGGTISGENTVAGTSTSPGGGEEQRVRACLIST